jgi:hypothetical protein
MLSGDGGGSGTVPTPASDTQQLDFAGRHHTVYVKSHLGFGLDAARERLLDHLIGRHGSGERPVRHPCLPRGAALTHKGVSLTGDADWQRCAKLQRHLFSSGSCGEAHCKWALAAGQPALPPVVYGFSYVYDRTAAIGLLDGKPAVYGSQTATLAQLERAGSQLCALDVSAVAQRFAGNPDESKRDNFCGDVAYVTAILAAFGLPHDTSIIMTNKIRDVELVWTLGAMLAESAKLAGASSGASFVSQSWQAVLGVLVPCALFGACAMRRFTRGDYSKMQTAPQD